MTRIGASEARIHLAALLKRVERGEEIAITRRGTPVARLVPAAHAGDTGLDEVIAAIRTAREETRLGGLDWRALRDGERP